MAVKYMFNVKTLIIGALALALPLLTACGGGGSSSDGDTANTYTIGGTIEGLTGTGLVLQNNGGDNLSINAGATSFTFGTEIVSGGAYGVTVFANPTSPSQSCTVDNGSGAVGSVSVTNVTVTCIPKTELVSRSTDDAATGTYYESEAPAMTPDGRYVAFVSSASNLAPGATNGKRHIFVRDRQSNQTVLISRSTGVSGTEGDDNSFAPSISSDGRFVVFESYASNLVAGDTNTYRDLFLRDLETQTTTRVSVGPSGVEANGESGFASISSDGRYVAFWSYADNLTASGVRDNVYVRDLQAATNTLVSVGLGGTAGNGVSGYPAISGDGSRIAFWSYASNLVEGDANGLWDIFLYDVNAATKITLVSVATDGTQKNQGSDSISRGVQPSISADGNVVAFSTTATSLVAGDLNATQDVFVHRIDTAETIRVSVGTGGTEANADAPVGQGERIALSSDGNWVAFSTAASNIAAGGANVVVRNISTDETFAITSSAVESSGAKGPAISGDGRYVAFGSSGQLDPRFFSSGIFVQDRTLP